MDILSFSCNMCGENHRKYLPSSTSITTCNKCGNLIELSSQRISRTNALNNNNRINYNNYLYDDNDDSYNSENNYLFNNSDSYEIDLLLNVNDFGVFSLNSIRPNIPPNRKRFNNNINFNNNDNNRNIGMFSIQIPNDNYNRNSALNHRSNFGYRGEDNNIHNFNDLDDDIFLQHEMENDLNLLSRIQDHNPRNNISFIGSLIVKSEKPKIKLQKIKMTKDLYTKNDGNINEIPSCCICLSPMKINQEVTLLKCQHLFHFNCLDKWIQNKEVCPFCRGKIEFSEINKRKEDKKINIIRGNINNIRGNINIRPIIGERKTNIIRANNYILNNNKNNKKDK